jgi:lipoprotein Spr
MKRLHYTYIYSFIAAIALILNGCSSQKSVTKPSGRNEPKISQIEHPVATTSAQKSELVKEARKWIGTKYQYGGHTKSGTDCSGLVMELFLKVYDLKLPRSSAQQREYSIGIDQKELTPGDLVFFATGSDRARVSHVGLYVGNGKMIHASTSRGVIESGLNEAYYANHYHSSGRVLAGTKEKAKKQKPEPKRPEPKPEKKPEKKSDEFNAATKQEQQRAALIQQMNIELEQKIDSVYVNDPEIFD